MDQIHKSHLITTNILELEQIITMELEQVTTMELEEETRIMELQCISLHMLLHLIQRSLAIIGLKKEKLQLPQDQLQLLKEQPQQLEKEQQLLKEQPLLLEKQPHPPG